MNFSRLFCITFSNNLNLLTRASISSDILHSDPGFGSCEETSPVASFACWCSASLSETFCCSFVSCASTSLCSILSVYNSQVPPNLRRAGGDRIHTSRMRSEVSFVHDLKIQLSLLLKVVLACHLCQNGLNHRTLRLFIPLTTDLQMAPKAVLSSVVFHDHRIPGGSKGSRFVRAPGDGTRGRELLRLRLGESACGSLLAPGSELLLK